MQLFHPLRPISLFSAAILGLFLAAPPAFPQETPASVAPDNATPLWMRYPALSPDGKTIAFAYRGHLFTVPSAGGDAVALTAGPAHDFQPVWSPDGQHIAYASDAYGNFDLFVVAACGGAAQRLTTYSTDEVPTGFSPDGLRVAGQRSHGHDAVSRLHANGVCRRGERRTPRSTVTRPS